MCIEREKNMDSVGYLYGDNPLKHSFPVFVAMTALSQIVSHVIYFLLKPLRQPKFVCSLLVSSYPCTFLALCRIWVLRTTICCVYYSVKLKFFLELPGKDL